MIDPVTGMWVSNVGIDPGPGGSATFGGIMDAFNVIQSLRYRRRLDAERQARLMEETARLGGSTTERLLDVPEYSESLREQGVNPESIRSFAGSDPALRYQREREALPPDATEQDFYRLGMRHGAVTPASLGTAVRQDRRLSNAALTEMLKSARTVFDKEMGRGATYEQAIEMAERQATSDPRLTPEQVEEFHERWAPIATMLPRERASAQAPTVAATIESKAAGADLARTRAEDLRKSFQKRMNLLDARISKLLRTTSASGAGKPLTEIQKKTVLNEIDDAKVELAKLETDWKQLANPAALRKQKMVIEAKIKRLEAMAVSGLATPAPSAPPAAAATPRPTATPSATTPPPTPTPTPRRRPAATGGNPLGL